MKKYFFLGLLSLVFAQTAFASTAQSPTQETACPQQQVSSLKIATDNPTNVDMQKVRNTWLSWYNTARSQNGLSAYVYQEDLNATASNWSFFAKKRGYIDHKRAGQKSYYDYKKVGQWFASKGVTFVSGSGRSDYVENIGWDYYSCSKADCTDELITAIKHTYNFFMSEKGKKYRAHYDSIMNKSYKQIGMGIAVDPVKKRYYLTVHYGTGVVTPNKTASDIAACSLSSGDHKF